MKEPKSIPPETPDTAAAPQAPDAASPEDTPPTPAQFHQNQAQRFCQSLAAEGEKVYERWGLAMLYSVDDEVIEEQREMLGLNPKDALDHYNHGCLLAHREKFAEAAAAFERAVKLDPTLAEASYNHAMALERAGQKPQARKAWMAHLENFADSPDAAQIKQHLTALADA